MLTNGVTKMVDKYIKCHKCFGVGCDYCDYTGIVNKDRGNKKAIDKYYNDAIIKRFKKSKLFR